MHIGGAGLAGLGDILLMPTSGEVKVAISFVSYEGAKANFEAEAKGNTFDKALTNTQEIWRQKMNKFSIETESLI